MEKFSSVQCLLSFAGVNNPFENIPHHISIILVPCTELKVGSSWFTYVLLRAVELQVASGLDNEGEDDREDGDDDRRWGQDLSDGVKKPPSACPACGGLLKAVGLTPGERARIRDTLFGLAGLQVKKHSKSRYVKLFPDHGTTAYAFKPGQLRATGSRVRGCCGGCVTLPRAPCFGAHLRSVDKLSSL